VSWLTTETVVFESHRTFFVTGCLRELWYRIFTYEETSILLSSEGKIERIWELM
jgi:hypothetical protein